MNYELRQLVQLNKHLLFTLLRTCLELLVSTQAPLLGELEWRYINILLHYKGDSALESFCTGRP